MQATFVTLELEPVSEGTAMTLTDMTSQLGELPATEAAPGADAETACVERIFEQGVGALELIGVYLGTKLGCYERLADGHWTTSSELAADLELAERYVREWCEQQAVAGLLEVDDADAASHARRFRLPAAHVGPLADADDPAHIASFALAVVGVANALDDVVAAYRSGGGVPYERYGGDFRHGQGRFNRPGSLHDLGTQWLPAAPDIHARLASGPARVADVGCGQGWSAIGFAQQYPQTSVVGYDTDAASIDDARRFAAERGVAERVHFDQRSAESIAGDGPFELVFMIEVLHDLAHPVEALAACRAALADDGAVIVVDEGVAEHFTAPGDLVERMMYGWSISHCLPAGMAEPGSAATGTVMRPETVVRYAADAGFSTTEMLEVEHDLYRFYRLRP